MRTFDKYSDPISKDKTPILMPLITADFFKDTGVKIRVGDEMKPIKKYWFTAEFYNQKEYDDFLKTLANTVL